MDRRAVAALVIAPLAAVAVLQFGNPATWLHGRDLHAWWTAELAQAAVLLTAYVVVPLAAAVALGVGPRALGLALGDAGRFWATCALVVGAALPVVIALSFTTRFRHVYPVFPPAVVGGRVLAAWLALHALMLVSVELFYRGFLLAMLRPTTGRYAVFIMIVPYALTHRDLVEAIGAVPVGWALGVLAARARSIWPGVVVHVAIGWTIELVAVWRPA